MGKRLVDEYFSSMSSYEPCKDFDIATKVVAEVPST
jgi:hypothetical protein